MSPRRALEIKFSETNSEKWRVALSEDAYDSFLARSGDAARKVFEEGSLFSPLLFGKFFDPADAFPLWEFESEVLLSGLRTVNKAHVDWEETEAEYVLKAELPLGARKCEAEICSKKGKVLEISGQWKGRESDSRDWRTSRWWEHGYVRSIELPENSVWRKAEAYVSDDIFLEIKIPKNISQSKALQMNNVEPKASAFV